MEKNRAMQELVKYREKLIQYGKVIAEGWLNGAFKNKALYEKLVKIQKKLN